VRALARWVTQAPGGHGAVREVADRLLASKLDCTAALDRLRASLWQSIAVRQTMAGSDDLLTGALRAAESFTRALMDQGRVFILAAGACAADAHWLGAEVSRRLDSCSRSVTVLTIPHSDAENFRIWADELRQRARPGDIALALLGDEDRRAVSRGLDVARSVPLRTLVVASDRHAIIGEEGIVIPSADSAFIREVHMWLGRVLCDYATRTVLDGSRADS
jgi:phosphoheptose isomerase